MEVLALYIFERLIIHLFDGLIGGIGYYLIKFTTGRTPKGVGITFIIIYGMSLAGGLMEAGPKFEDFDWWGPVTASIGAVIAHIVGRTQEKTTGGEKNLVNPASTVEGPKLLQLSVLRTRWFRFFLSLVPFSIFIGFLTVHEGVDRTIRNIAHEPHIFILVWAATACIIYIVFTIILRIINNWRKSFLVRVMSFGSLVWAASVLLCVLLFEPYGNSLFGSYYSGMGGEDYWHMFFIMLTPPALITSATYVYLRYIRSYTPQALPPSSPPSMPDRRMRH